MDAAKPDNPELLNTSDNPIALADLRLAVRKTDPAALLVLPRILRRVIKQDRRLAGYLYRIPHRKSYVIDRDALLEIVDREELEVSAEENLPEKLILLAQPLPDKLAAMPGGAALLRCWRLLFHARIHLAVQQCFILGFLSPSQLRKRIHAIGETEFEEIRTVLQQESFLLPPRGGVAADGPPAPRNSTSSSTDDAAVYEEFAAVFFELKYFAWNSLPRCFPGLRDMEEIAAVLELDVDAGSLFKTTRPEGAPDPHDATATEELAEWSVDPDERPFLQPLISGIAPASAEKFRKLLRRAQHPESLGNVVRAAIWRAKALRYAPSNMTARTKTAIRDDVNRLICRLHNALELEDPSPQPWHDTLRALVYSAADGFWTAEGRLLYDLQKVCLDREREVYSTHLPRWLWSHFAFFLCWLRNYLLRTLKRGEQTGENESLPNIPPLKKPLPNQRDVLMSQHLRTAERRLAAVRLPELQRRQLSELLRTAIDRVEIRLRERFRPLILAALDEVGLVPANYPEKIARDKLIEELLDKVAERGFMSIGDLRDALSRNNMKLPDFGGVKDLYYGDPLLKADRRLGEILNGVYRPAEFYLRWLQQVTSLGFGTNVGRLLTKYVAVPIGGAFLIFKFIEHLFSNLLPHIEEYEKPIILFLSILFFGLVNLEFFRRFILWALKQFWRFFHRWLFTPIWRLVHSQLVQSIIHGRWFVLFYRFAVKPAFLTALIWYFIPAKYFTWEASSVRVLIVFLGLSVLLNSRVGRTFEEMFADWTFQTWQRYGLRLLTGAFWWLVDFFKTVLETVERLMYGVDEWMRFKSGDSSILFGAKAALETVWTVFAYIVRFCVTLLIEPQINPIKHFPVVTVSHKLLLPLYPVLGGIFAVHMDKELAYTTATLIIWCIPGVFGFLVWELKENWRLYAANRAKGLRPMIIGSHGEPMGRLIRPGLHSGTIPKLFAKLRRAERKARRTGNWKTVRKHLHGFKHVEISLQRFLERDFLPLYNGTREKTPGEEISTDSPPQTEIALQAIELDTNRVRLVFISAENEESLVTIDFEVQSGWLIADTKPSTALQKFSENDRNDLATAIFGLYKTAGVEVVRRQIENALPAPFAYDFSGQGLRIWPDGSFETEVVYEFRDEATFEPRILYGFLRRPLPPLERTQILFNETILLWQNWIEFWDALQHGRRLNGAIRINFPLLPPK